MAEHVNFYENLKEADIRLKDTIVMYDGEPYYVLFISNHKADGVFRIYLDKLGQPGGLAMNRIAMPYNDFGSETSGKAMDEWLDKHPNEGVIRKMMNSPKFNKFRPFPLGMCNNRGKVLYMERTPVRYTQQGLVSSMLTYNEFGPLGSSTPIRSSTIPQFGSYEFYACIMGIYPTVDECLKNLKDDEVTNDGMAFHRSFTIMRGPLGMMLLGYKTDLIGYMPHGDRSSIIINQKYRHTKEVVQELNIFEDIKVV